MRIISNRLDLLQVLLIFSILLGGPGSSAETSAFTVSPVASVPRTTSPPINGTFGSTSDSSKAGNLSQETALAAQRVDEEEAIETEDENSSDDINNNLLQAQVSKRLKSRQILPVVGLVTLSVVSLAAKLGVLGVYTNAMIAQDVGAAVLTGTLGYIFVKGCTWLAENQYLDPRDSRKIIHTLSAPLFIVFWPLFSPAEGARFFAASVSFVNVVRLFIAGSGGDKSLAYAVSRSGNQNEALGGPFLYVLILLASILTFWRDGPVGIVALSAMAAGDGLADLLGRRYGKNNKWWFNQDKSIAGSLAFWVGATACSSLLLKWLSIPLTSSLLPGSSPYLVLGAIMAITALLEVIPGTFDDNWVVPLSAAVLTMVAFS